MNKIKKNDVVFVLSGKDKGKKGKVLLVVTKDNKIIVENVALVKRHQKQSQKFQGGIIERPSAIPISKVAIMCPRCSKPARVGIRFLEAAKKRVRFCRKCQEVIDKV